MTDDAELLRRYATDASEGAFAELVQRHLGLVYHAARRQCGGDGHLAEDVAQGVFAALARKAASLTGRTTLAGWLYTSTRYAALQAVRAEARRRAREQEAERLSAVDAADAAGPDAWARLEPVIDEALRALPERDREAVLLRFFERWPLAEVGARFGLSEDAARMRIERALGKLRRILGRRGVTSTAAALAAALEAHAAAAAPAGLAATVVAGAVGGAAAAGAAAGAVLLMSTTKVSVGVMIVLLAAGTAGLAWQHRVIRRLQGAAASSAQLAVENRQLRAENARLERAAAPVAARPAAAAAAVPAPARGGRAVVPLAAGLVPVESLGNAGQGSARSAFATQLWAARTGDVALEAGTLLLSADEKAKLEALRPTLPADIQSQYPTPEDLLAFALAGSPHPVGGMQVLGETAQGPDDVTLETQWQHTDDDVVHQNSVQFHDEGGTWKMVVPPVIVNRAALFLSR